MVAAIVSVIGNLVAIFIKVLPIFKDWTASRRLTYFTRNEIKEATRYFVKPLYQDRDPATALDEAGDHPPGDDLFEKIDYLLKKPEEFKYILLMGGTGTGKTTFLLNYFANYQSLFRINRFQIVILPLGFVEDAAKVIKKIKFKSRTVLCLDALDEDADTHQFAQDNKYEQRIWDLCSMTRSFRSVIITCRTQFFPKEVLETLTTKINKPAPVSLGQSGEFEFHKYYIAYFTDQQIWEYLQRRFPTDQKGLRENAYDRARELVDRIPQLTMRPMILAYIDDLVRSRKDLSYTFQIYQEIVDAWINREKYWDKKALRKLSGDLAIYLFRKSQEGSGAHIAKHDLSQFEHGEKIKRWKIAGRSLLNHDARGNYKFAHRSIMEFLIVQQFIKGDMQTQDLGWTEQMQTFMKEGIQSCRKRGELYPSAIPVADLSQYGIVPYMKLRDKPLNFREAAQVTEMLKAKDFYDKNKNKTGKGLIHDYQVQSKGGKKVVIDYRTNLMWQHSGSEDRPTWNNAKAFVKKLNDENFAGYRDWRLPTLEEAMSLMERKKKNGDLYIDPVFDQKQRRIWTADQLSASRAWSVYFYGGYCYRDLVDYDNVFARAVRS